MFLPLLVFSQNTGLGTLTPTHTLHVKPEASNPNQDPIRLENLQSYDSNTDSHLLVVDPETGIVRIMELHALQVGGVDLDSDPRNEIQNASTVELSNELDLDGNSSNETTVQEALEALLTQQPKGIYKSIDEARSAGLVDGDAFYAHPNGVFGCSGCIIKLVPGMD